MNSRCIRSGYINSALVLFLGSAALLVALIALLRWNPATGPTEPGQRLVVYCAAGLRGPVEAVAKEYEKAFGVEVQLQFGGSQILLANIEVSKRGDLYIPADDYYIRLAENKKLLDEVIPLAEMTPVIAVAKGNPKKIQSLEQLLSGQYKVAQANPDLAAVGRVTRDILPAKEWELLEKATKIFRPTVNDVANDVQLGAADAGIVWNATIALYSKLDMVAAPELAKKKALVSVTVLKCSTQPTAALTFARYLAARDKGLLAFQRAGLQVVEGDVWADAPVLRLFAGAMLRPAIEKTIKDFEEREGVQITPVYNGCGILVAQMKTGARPDAYFACEKSFMTQVHDLFLGSVDVSSNHLVIAVRKGNPHNIKTLDDLGKPGLKVGIGNEQQCAMGAITQQTLVQGGKQKKVMENVKVQTPTGDMLMLQLVGGSLDAVIVYISNTANTKDVEAYAIEGIPCANAVQPMAIGKDSQFKQLSGRLMSALRSQHSRERFESYGFGWQDAK